jgi:hypothetical protein
MVQKQQRSSDDLMYALRQRYLIQLTERIGTLNLVQIDSDGRGIALERVYVPPLAEGYVSFAPEDDWKDGEPSRDSFQLSVEVQDWHVVDWWIDKMESVWESFTTYAYDKAPRHHADYWGFEEAPLLAHVAQIKAAIERYRRANPELKPDDEYRARNKWCNGRHDRVSRLDMADLATLRNRLIILGGPGSGKSTFVWHLALCLAGAQIVSWNREATLDQLGIWSHGPLIPVYIELKRFVASDQYPTDYAINPSAETAWRYIEAELNASDLARYAVDLQSDLVQGRAVLILDGLDDVPYDDNKLPERRRQLRALIADLSQTYSHSRIIATSRPSAYERWELPGFDRIAIGHSQSLVLAKQQQHMLATQIYQVAGLAPDVAVAKSNAFMSQLVMVDSELIGSPIIMTMLATMFFQSAEGRFPTRRSSLYQQIIRLLLERAMKAKPDIGPLPDIWHNATIDNLFERFAALAYDVQETAESNGPKSATPEIDKDLLIKHLNPDSERIGFDLVNYLNENLAVLVGSSQNAERDIFRFTHRPFQEYLAAWEIVHRCQQTEPANSFALLRKLIQDNPLAWRAPGLLVADVLLDNRAEADLWSLISDLLGDNLPTNRAADDPHWWSLWLAAAIVDQQRLLMDIPARPEIQRTCALLRDYILLAESTEALPATERAMCNKLLFNWLGDLQPITIVGMQHDGLPDITWCEVPDSGEWLYQNVKYEPVPTFFMATKHVLDAQFQAFVDASDGFRNPLWWAGLHPDGLKQQLSGPGAPPNRFGNYSRVDVSWYDAMAFCRWLSAKMGYDIMLPTELQCKKFYSAFDSAGDIGEWTSTEFGSKDSNIFDNNETRSVVVSRDQTKNVFPEDRDPHISFRVCCRADARRTHIL